jgi:hypothetical protein
MRKVWHGGLDKGCPRVNYDTIDLQALMDFHRFWGCHLVVSSDTGMLPRQSLAKKPKILAPHGYSTRQTATRFLTHAIRQHEYINFVCSDSASVLKWRREPYSQHKDI